jgi:hypothetical protein
MIATGCPWIDSGRKGAGGAVVRLRIVVSSSGRPLPVHSAKKAHTSAARSPAKTLMPP